MIQIIDYNSGNLRSVENALKILNESYEIISRPDDVRDKAKIIFPGVGAARVAMENLKSSGFDRVIPSLKQPFLGICLGMQLLMQFSEEGDTECLGVLKGKVRKFDAGVIPGDVFPRGKNSAVDSRDFPRSKSRLKIPQIGWNKVFIQQNDPLFTGIPDEAYFYFVNSYYVAAANSDTLGQSFYGTGFCSIIKKDNFYGTQFHPEKSSEIGMKLFSNFCKLC